MIGRIGFRVKGTLKSEMVPVIDCLFDVRGNQVEVAKKFPEYNFLGLWSKFEDSTKIPWIKQPPWEYTEWEHNLRYKDRRYAFQVELDVQIETYTIFMVFVLKHLMEKVRHCEIYTEKRAWFFELVNGKFYVEKINALQAENR